MSEDATGKPPEYREFSLFFEPPNSMMDVNYMRDVRKDVWDISKLELPIYFYQPDVEPSPEGGRVKVVQPEQKKRKKRVLVQADRDDAKPEQQPWVLCSKDGKKYVATPDTLTDRAVMYQQDRGFTLQFVSNSLRVTEEHRSGIQDVDAARSRQRKEEEEEKSQSQSHRKQSLPRDDPSEELKEESFLPSSFTPEAWDAFLASETQRIAQSHPAPRPPRGLQSTDSGLWMLQNYSSFFPAVFNPNAFALCVYWHLPSSQRSVDNLAFLEQKLAEFPTLRVLVVDLSLFPQLLCQLDAAPLSLQCFLFGSLVDSSAEDLQATFLSFARSLDSHYTEYLLDIKPHTSMDPSEFRRRAIQNETFGIYPLMNEIATALDTLLHNLHIECADVEKERSALEVGKRKHANRSFCRKCFRTCSTIRTIRNYTGFEEVPRNCASS